LTTQSDAIISVKRQSPVDNFSHNQSCCLPPLCHHYDMVPPQNVKKVVKPSMGEAACYH